MQLSARILQNVASINQYRYATEVRTFVGQALDVTIQLADLDQNPSCEGFHPAGLRYVPQAGATMTVAFRNLDAAKAFPRVAVQPFAQDPSIWRVSILASDPLRGTVDLRVTLTEGGAGRTFLLPAAVLVDDGTGLA